MNEYMVTGESARGFELLLLSMARSSATLLIHWDNRSFTLMTIGKVTYNSADQLVSALNENRTANHLKSLYDNPGLACLALQYIKAYEGNYDEVGGTKAKKPDDSEFANTFAPTCVVETSTLSQITGRLLACQSKYIYPSEAFSGLLMKSNKSLEILFKKNHTEVRAAVSGSDGGAPYFWCVFISNGKSNSNFVFCCLLNNIIFNNDIKFEIYHIQLGHIKCSIVFCCLPNDA